MRQQLHDKTKSLKILYAMIKSPKMCDMLQKAERKYLTKERLKQVTENAILTLRQYRFDENVNQFVDQIYGTVCEQVANNTDPFIQNDTANAKQSKPQDEMQNSPVQEIKSNFKTNKINVSKLA